MRHVLAPTREDREGEWTIAAGTVINLISIKPFNQTTAERFTDGTTEKARESSQAKAEPFQASKIL